MSDGDRPRKGDDDERQLDADEETLPGPIPGAAASSPGLTERDEKTVHAGFSGGSADSDDDDGATVVELPVTEMPTMEVQLGRDDATIHEDLEETMDGASVDFTALPSRGEPTLANEVETTELDTDPAEGDTHSESTGGPGRASRTLAEDEETLAGDVSTTSGSATGAEPGATQPGRRQQTIADEGETIFEPGMTGSGAADPNATVADRAAASGGLGGSGTDPAISRGASKTARDIAAGASSTGIGRGGESSAPLRLAEGELLAGRYTLVKRLGKGGMGEVWRARHNLLQGDRAIKVIKASISKDKDFRARFLTEGQTMMSVKHPGVVEVTDLDETRGSGELFMVMEHLEGRTLYDAIRDNENPLCNDVRDVVRIYKEFAEGMQKIHDVRIVHKDLKSDNALLVRGDDGLEHPKVIDFGLAKRVDAADADVKTGVGDDGEMGYEPDLRTTLSGTLAYMSPEQFLGRASSYQSDIYAFGVMFQECFTKGEYPLPRGGLAHYLQLHAEGAKPAKLASKRSDLDPYLTELSDRCMAVKKEERPESFREVADALQWWLDIPLRRERRNKRLGMAAVVVFLLSTTIATYFLAGDSVAMSQMQASVGGNPVDARDGLVYLNEDALATLRLSADIEGDPDGPSITVGGAEVVADIVHDAAGGTLSATADLSTLPDGRHEVAFLASSGAKPAKLVIVIDRKAPTIESLNVPGAIEGFVSNENPDLRLVLDEVTIDRVTARVAGGKTQPGQASEQSMAEWSIGGTSLGEGKLTNVEVEVVDFAGNRATQRIAYTQDTTEPAPRIQDLRDDPATGGQLLPVRSGVGARILVWVAESGSVSLTANGAQQSQDHGVGSVEFELPAVPPDGYSCTLVSADRAGNSVTETFTVMQKPDVATLTTLDGKPGASVDGRGDVKISMGRFYGLSTDGLGVSATRTRKSDGTAVKEPPSEIAAQVGAGTAYAVEVTIKAGELSEGTWNLSPRGQGAASPAAFMLTIDPSAPVVHGVRIMTAGGAVVAPDAWAQTRRLVVEVDASDLALESITLEGADGPNPAPSSGRNTYRFNAVFTKDGETTRVLKLQDAAGNSFEQTIEFKVDETNPTLTVTSPRSGQPGLDNKNPVDFVAQASEADCTLHVESPAGLRGGSVAVRADAGSRNLKATVQLVQGDHDVTVWTTDPSGRESPRNVVRLTVENLETKLPPEIRWTKGVTTLMEKVDEGEIVVENRMFPVAEGYVDRTEVTNAAYRQFLAATKGAHGPHCHADEPADWDHTPDAETWNDPEWSADDLPVVSVSYWDAYSYAHWTGRRLPTEADWVKAAAKKPGELDLWRYPIGNEWQDGLLVTAELISDSPFKGPRSATTGSDVSPNRCLHLGGNASEWVELDRVPQGEPDVAARGGNWYLSKVAAAIGTKAIRYPRSLRAATIGFRCAVDGDVVRAVGAEAPKD